MCYYLSYVIHSLIRQENHTEQQIVSPIKSLKFQNIFYSTPG